MTAPYFNNRGTALTIAIVMIICSSILAGYSLQSNWNQYRMGVVSGSKRDRTFWAAKAGYVDARWRIRAGIRNNNSTGLFPGGSFQNDAYDPDVYTLDLNVPADGVVDVRVNIGPVNGNGVRPINSRGIDN